MADEHETPQLSPPPHFGQHTKQVFKDVLQLSDAQVEELRNKSVVV